MCVCEEEREREREREREAFGETNLREMVCERLKTRSKTFCNPLCPTGNPSLQSISHECVCVCVCVCVRVCLLVRESMYVR